MADDFNWQAVYSRLEETRRVIEAGRNYSPEETKRILKGRAQALAKPMRETVAATDVLDLLVFSLSEERLGIETAHVMEAAPLEGLTPVPCTPAFVLGVVNHRGRIIPVMDLRRLLGLPVQGTVEGWCMVAVEAGGMTLGILAESVIGTVQVETSQMAPPPTVLSGTRRAFLRGVTAEMIAVLDIDAMTRDRLITVNEEIV